MNRVKPNFATKQLPVSVRGRGPAIPQLLPPWFSLQRIPEWVLEYRCETNTLKYTVGSINPIQVTCPAYVRGVRPSAGPRVGAGTSTAGVPGAALLDKTLTVSRRPLSCQQCLQLGKQQLYKPIPKGKRRDVNRSLLLPYVMLCDMDQQPNWLLVHVRVNWLQHLICSDIFIYISGHEYETMNIAQQLLQSLNISNISMMSNVKKNYNLKSPKGHRVFKYFKY